MTPDTHTLRTQLRKARAANAVLAFLLFTILTALMLTYAAH